MGTCISKIKTKDETSQLNLINSTNMPLTLIAIINDYCNREKQKLVIAKDFQNSTTELQIYDIVSRQVLEKIQLPRPIRVHGLYCLTWRDQTVFLISEFETSVKHPIPLLYLCNEKKWINIPAFSGIHRPSIVNDTLFTMEGGCGGPWWHSWNILLDKAWKSRCMPSLPKTSIDCHYNFNTREVYVECSKSGKKSIVVNYPTCPTIYECTIQKRFYILSKSRSQYFKIDKNNKDLGSFIDISSPRIKRWHPKCLPFLNGLLLIGGECDEKMVGACEWWNPLHDSWTKLPFLATDNSFVY